MHSPSTNKSNSGAQKHNHIEHAHYEVHWRLEHVHSEIVRKVEVIGKIETERKVAKYYKQKIGDRETKWELQGNQKERGVN